jgi:hypothetical protein
MKYDLDRIKAELDTLPEWKSQIYLQGDSPDMDPFEPTIGQNFLLVDKTEELYTYPLFNIPYINGIIEEHKLCRTRVMKMKPKTCYYWHKDSTPRLHIPVVTHEHCFLILENEGRVHLPADGTAYIVDTTQHHSAMNCSKIDRTHIVGCL